jgi:hypothetical protein
MIWGLRPTQPGALFPAVKFRWQELSDLEDGHGWEVVIEADLLEHECEALHAAGLALGCGADAEGALALVADWVSSVSPRVNISRAASHAAALQRLLVLCMIKARKRPFGHAASTGSRLVGIRANSC